MSESRKREYMAYLKSAQWKATLERYKKSGRPSRCAWCDRTAPVRHLTYDRYPGSELPTDLLCLCGKHYGLVQGARYTTRLHVPARVTRWLN